MLKLKRTCKKAKGLKARAQREEFLDRLKNPQKYAKLSPHSNEILKKIRERNKYNTDASKIMDSLKELAGLK